MDSEPVRVHVDREQAMYEHRLPDLQPATAYSVLVSCGFRGQPARLDITTLSDQEANTVLPTDDAQDQEATTVLPTDNAQDQEASRVRPANLRASIHYW